MNFNFRWAMPNSLKNLKGVHRKVLHDQRPKAFFFFWDVVKCIVIEFVDL